jgi:hypothetical protein
MRGGLHAALRCHRPCRSCTLSTLALLARCAMVAVRVLCCAAVVSGAWDNRPLRCHCTVCVVSQDGEGTDTSLVLCCCVRLVCVASYEGIPLLPALLCTPFWHTRRRFFAPTRGRSTACVFCWACCRGVAAPPRRGVVFVECESHLQQQLELWKLAGCVLQRARRAAAVFSD